MNRYKCLLFTEQGDTHRSVAMRWMLWLTLLHTAPSPFWLYVIAGAAPAAGLLGAGIAGLMLGDRESLAMGIVLGAQGLVYCVVYYLLARLLEALICRVRRRLPRNLLLLALVLVSLASTLAPIYAIYGHSGGDSLNIVALFQGFVRPTAVQIAYPAGFLLLLASLGILQGIPLPRFLLAVQRRAPPAYAFLLAFAGLVGMIAIYNNRVHIFCAPAGDAGQVWAQLCVARSLRDGPAGPASVDAIKWYQRAAEQGSRTAIRELLAITRNHEVRRRWLPVLAREGDSDARVAWWDLVRRNPHAEAQEMQLALTWLSEAAREGHSEAALELGRHLVSTDPGTARSWWEQAAAAGNGDALRELAWRLAAGAPGFPINLSRAAEYYARLADGVEQGRYATRMYTLSAARYRQEAHEIEALLQGAAAGDAAVQLQLGQRILDAGNVGEEGLQEAVGWLEKAAAQGNLTAQHLLGQLFIFGRKGLEVDLARGRRWWDRAVAQAHAPTLKFVAEARISGKYGYPVDLAAARQGFEILTVAYSQGIHGVEADPRSARYWQDALRDTERRIASLGPAYQPMQTLREQARSGDPEAQYRLGQQLLQSYSTEAHQEALNWWIRAAEAGHHQAQFQLVSYYDRGGPYIGKDQTRALELLQSAAAGKHPQAMHSLGLAYEKGRYGLQQDLLRAGEIYRVILSARESNTYDWDVDEGFYRMVQIRATAVERMLGSR